jgi:uncharacterized protein (DUF2147 family)
MKRKEALLFVNKKKQKNFAKLGPCRFDASGLTSKKFFAPLFFKKAATFFLLFLLALPAAAQPPAAPIGRWLTANRQAVLQVTSCGANFCGRLVGIIVRHAGDPMPLDWRGRLQCGFVMLRTTRQIGTAVAARWAGTVQDPRDGAIYNAIIWVGPDGNLRLRGYVGLPLFGETQSWSPFSGRTFADCRLPGNNPNG